ncbi:MAG: archease [Candidatus Micrarchaeia archaeon]
MYRYLEHTADELLEVQAPTLSDALHDAVMGSFELIGKGENEETDFEVEVHSPTLKDLVVDLLQQVVAQCEIREISPVGVEVMEVNEGEPMARIIVRGEHAVPPNEIKAVTYHRLKVEKKNGDWHLTILFDV